MPLRTDEQVRVVDAILFDRVAERPDDVLLAHHVCERAGAMTAVQRSGHGSVESRGATSRLGVRAAIGIPLGALVAWLLIGAGFLNYDTAYSLLWGQDALHLRGSDMSLTLSPTPHPLATVIGALLSLLGDAAQPAWVVLAFLALGALAWLTYELGAHWFGPAAGIVAAVVILTRIPVLSFGVRAYVDIPYVALVLGAILAEARREAADAPPRRAAGTRRAAPRRGVRPARRRRAPARPARPRRPPAARGVADLARLRRLAPRSPAAAARALGARPVGAARPRAGRQPAALASPTPPTTPTRSSGSPASTTCR